MNPLAPLPAPGPEVSLYRGHCIALLRRYFCMSVEIGRLPAILGREIFTTRAEDYHVHSFEDIVLFVIDIERALDRLPYFDKNLIALVVLQEYTQEEVAQLLGYTDRQIRNRFHDAIDSLTALLLEQRLLTPENPRRTPPPPPEELSVVVELQSCAELDTPVLAGAITSSQFVPAVVEVA